MNYKDIYIEQLQRHYCTSLELQYNSIYGYFLSFEELNGLRDYIDDCEENFKESLIRFDLKSFNSKHIFFSRCVELSQLLVNFGQLLIDDLNEDDHPLAIRNMSEIMKSRIYSELEGSLDIENVPTTRTRFNNLVIKGEQPKNTNDQIIKNMANAIEFVLRKPAFNKENLFTLYSILSKNSLDSERRLKDGDYYRYDKVYIDEFEGCPVDQIEECMDSLFAYVNNNINNKNYLQFYLPHIAHYYILYISHY